MLIYKLRDFSGKRIFLAVAALAIFGCGEDKKKESRGVVENNKEELTLKEGESSVIANLKLAWDTAPKLGEFMSVRLVLEREQGVGDFELVSFSTTKSCGCSGFHSERQLTPVDADTIQLSQFKFTKAGNWKVTVKYRVGEKEFEHEETVSVAK